MASQLFELAREKGQRWHLHSELCHCPLTTNDLERHRGNIVTKIYPLPGHYLAGSGDYHHPLHQYHASIRGLYLHTIRCLAEIFLWWRSNIDASIATFISAFPLERLLGHIRTTIRYSQQYWNTYLCCKKLNLHIFTTHGNNYSQLLLNLKL